ncbi:MAG: ParD-like family protein [Herminiimonas sp.]|uniref:ParD-like family protein n=1 Tax=Herminiimonas sp. TaxID=1926289 RepID=UPI00271B5094|nr:ParD-like family protein [Herminiimonas sp.]MDO9420942.1 ParD-like family protein [Herminiimonas sp.]
MGIVKITEQMHVNLRLSSGAMSRSINSQAEHWLRVGMMAELNPGLCYNEICQKLREAEQQAAESPQEITLSLEKA